MKYFLALGCALLFNAAANLMMKAGMAGIAERGGVMKDGPVAAVLAVLGNPVLVIGLTCFALNAACYMYALQCPALKISIAYPLMVGGGYAIIATVAYLFMSERLTPGQWIGVTLILAGVITVAALTPPDKPADSIVTAPAAPPALTGSEATRP
ncbi:MAG: cation transporter [Phycisphaerales bacterium]|nr:MAG: cation transporter [Phycisphaerales bacterium]